MRVFPELAARHAQALYPDLRGANLKDLVARSATSHGLAFYPPLGERVSEKEIQELQEAVRGAAMQFGYPSRVLPSSQIRQFNQTMTSVVHAKMNIPAGVARRAGTWNFLACVVLPDIVHWRWADEEGIVHRDRYIQNSRRRNLFWRAWWWGELLFDNDAEEPYHLVSRLGEDNMENIFGRASIASHPRLCLAVASRLASHPRAGQDLLRDAMKRILRFLPFLCIEAMNQENLDALVAEMFDASDSVLNKSREESDAGLLVAETYTMGQESLPVISEAATTELKSSPIRTLLQRVGVSLASRKRV